MLGVGRQIRLLLLAVSRLPYAVQFGTVFLPSQGPLGRIRDNRRSTSDIILLTISTHCLT